MWGVFDWVTVSFSRRTTLWSWFYKHINLGKRVSWIFTFSYVIISHPPYKQNVERMVYYRQLLCLWCVVCEALCVNCVCYMAWFFSFIAKNERWVGCWMYLLVLWHLMKSISIESVKPDILYLQGWEVKYTPSAHTLLFHYFYQCHKHLPNSFFGIAAALLHYVSLFPRPEIV
jgi:hypothetical protein